MPKNSHKEKLNKIRDDIANSNPYGLEDSDISPTEEPDDKVDKPDLVRTTNVKTSAAKKAGDGIEYDLVSTGFKVKHKKSGILYTVNKKKDDTVILKTPTQKKFQVSSDEFEEDYERA